jgi:hypothetical protein
MSKAGIIYLPAYTRSQQARMDRLGESARPIYESVVAALDDADSLAGPEIAEYLELLRAVIEEAEERRVYCRQTRG